MSPSERDLKSDSTSSTEGVWGKTPDNTPSLSYTITPAVDTRSEDNLLISKKLASLVEDAGGPVDDEEKEGASADSVCQAKSEGGDVSLQKWKHEAEKHETDVEGNKAIDASDAAETEAFETMKRCSEHPGDVRRFIGEGEIGQKIWDEILEEVGGAEGLRTEEVVDHVDRITRDVEKQISMHEVTAREAATAAVLVACGESMKDATHFAEDADHVAQV
eukprot:gene6778-12757_t